MPDSAFDAWYNEIEGFALRAERLTGPKDELMAAFEAGRAAERERCAKVADVMFEKLYGEPGLQAAYERSILGRIGAAIRSPSLKEQEEGN